MKKNYLLVFFPLGISVAYGTSAISQGAWQHSNSIILNTATPDTLSIIKRIIGNKDKYLDKELSVLFNKLELPIKSYSIINHRIDIIDGIMISFDYYQTTINKLSTITPPVLKIIFKTPLSTAAYQDLVSKKKPGSELIWQDVEKEFYSKLIIGDLK